MEEERNARHEKEQEAHIEEACSELEKMIDEKQSSLDKLQEEIDLTETASTAVTRKQIETADEAAAVEVGKHDLACLLSQAKSLDCHPVVFLSNKPLLVSLARAWQSQSKTEMQQLLVEEKLRAVSLKEKCERKTRTLMEHKMILKAYLKKKEALEAAELQRLTVQVEDLNDHCDAMISVMDQLFDNYFPAPQIPGYDPMRKLMQELMKPVRLRRRSTYIRVKESIWPYYLEMLESNGIIEHHPVDKSKIRLIDFSGGLLGLGPEEMEAVKEREEEKRKIKAEKRLKKNMGNDKLVSRGQSGKGIVIPKILLRKDKMFSKGIVDNDQTFLEKGEEDTREEDEDWEEIE